MESEAIARVLILSMTPVFLWAMAFMCHLTIVPTFRAWQQRRREKRIHMHENPKYVRRTMFGFHVAKVTGRTLSGEYYVFSKGGIGGPHNYEEISRLAFLCYSAKYWLWSKLLPANFNKHNRASWHKRTYPKKHEISNNQRNCRHQEKAGLCRCCRRRRLYIQNAGRKINANNSINRGFKFWRHVEVVGHEQGRCRHLCCTSNS